MSGAPSFPANEKNVCANRPQLYCLVEELTKPSAGPAVHDHGDGGGLGSIAAQRLDGLQRSLAGGRGVLDDDGWLNTTRSKIVVSAKPVAPDGEEVT